MRWALCLLALLLTACEPNTQLFKQRLLQFGTIVDISIIHDDSELVERSFSEVEQKLQLYERYWHAWRENSHLYRFNQSLIRMKPVLIPDSLLELITVSKQYYQSSQKLFNPALGKLVAAYGFHDPAAKNQAVIDEIRLDLPTMDDISIKNKHALSLNPHLQLDFGGIAKGLAMKKLAHILKSKGFQHFIINIGGDILISGDRFGKPWTIAIQNPFGEGALASIELQGNHQLFTSGNYQRYYRSGEDIVHHIIDPRDGMPSANVSSATVMVSDPVLADVAATTLMIDGWRNHRELARSLAVQDYLIVNQNGRIIVSRSMANKIRFLIGENLVEIY